MSADARQVGGDHYKRMDVQPWTAMASWMSDDMFAGFLLGNVIKYLARNKGGRDARMQDLHKARHYLEKLIETLEKAP